MADMNVSGGIGTVTLSPPSGTAVAQTILFVGKEVAFAVEGRASDISWVTKIVANVVTGIEQNNLVTCKSVAYAVLRVVPTNRRRASWLFVGQIPT